MSACRLLAHTIGISRRRSFFFWAGDASEMMSASLKPADAAADSGQMANGCSRHKWWHTSNAKRAARRQQPCFFQLMMMNSERKKLLKRIDELCTGAGSALTLPLLATSLQPPDGHSNSCHGCGPSCPHLLQGPGWMPAVEQLLAYCLIEDDSPHGQKPTCRT